MFIVFAGESGGTINIAPVTISGTLSVELVALRNQVIPVSGTLNGTTVSVAKRALCSLDPGYYTIRIASDLTAIAYYDLRVLERPTRRR